MPLARGPDGRLGVRGGGGTQVTVNIQTPDAQSFAALAVAGGGDDGAGRVARTKEPLSMTFDDIRFPRASRAAQRAGRNGAPKSWCSALVREERNSRWADSRRRYNAGFGVKSLDDIHAVVAFFEERRGRLHGFRWKDHADFKSCPPRSRLRSIRPSGRRRRDTRVPTGQDLCGGLRTYARTITKPVAGSVLVAVDGVARTSRSTI